MITGKQLRIFEAFAKSPFSQFTRNDVRRITKEKSNNSLALAVNRLLEEGVLVERRIGKSGLLSLDLGFDVTFYYLALCNKYRMSQQLSLTLNHIVQEASEATPFFSVVFFGSYAAGTQRKDSDLDIAVFIDDSTKQASMEALINSATLKSLVSIDAHIISRKEMVDMLTNKDENLGKMIARKHMAVFNHRIFYDIVKEAMSHGFRI